MVEPSQKLHIVAAPLHFIFNSMVFHRPHAGRSSLSCALNSDTDRVYLISAHVEASETSGLSGLLRHLSGHFSSVANYCEGEKIGRTVLKGRPCDLSLIEKLEYPDFSVPSRKSYLDGMKEFLHEKWYMTIYLFLVFTGFLLAEFFGFIDFRALFFWTLGLTYPYNRLYWGIFGIFGVGSSYYFFRNGFRSFPEAEKWSLFVISFGLAALFAGVFGLHSSIFGLSNQLIDLYIVFTYLWILNWYYLLGVFFPRWRFITIAVVTLALEIVFLIWFPDFLYSMGVSSSLELQILLAVGFALLISVFVGLFYNFMKSVELILELEHSFALFVGKKGVSRTIMKQKLGELMGIEEKGGLFERLTGVVRVYLGFRSQGTVEFHLDLPQEGVSSTDAAETPELHDFALYPLRDVLFDGTSLTTTIETSLGPKLVEFKDFQPQ